MGITILSKQKKPTENPVKRLSVSFDFGEGLVLGGSDGRV
jgi:hypothetical protein